SLHGGHPHNEVKYTAPVHAGNVLKRNHHMTSRVSQDCNARRREQVAEPCGPPLPGTRTAAVQVAYLGLWPCGSTRRKRYPKPRTVSMQRASAPSVQRRRCRCMSTVRVRMSGCARHTVSSYVWRMETTTTATAPARASQDHVSAGVPALKVVHGLPRGGAGALRRGDIAHDGHHGAISPLLDAHEQHVVRPGCVRQQPAGDIERRAAVDFHDSEVAFVTIDDEAVRFRHRRYLR